MLQQSPPRRPSPVLNGLPQYSLTDDQVRVLGDALAQAADTLATNASMSRKDFLRAFGDPRRDIDDECGYPRGWVGPEFYHNLYLYDPIAARVVECLPKETWQVTPDVFEDPDEESVTAFEQSWDELGAGLRGENSWFAQERGSPVWEYLLRLDIQSRIGQYGVLLMLFDDGETDLSLPVKGVVEKNSRPVKAEPDGEEEVPGREGEPPTRKPRFKFSQVEPSANVGRGNTPRSRYTPDGVYGITFNAKLAFGDGGPDAGTDPEEEPDEDEPPPDDEEGGDGESDEDPEAPSFTPRRRLVGLRVFPEALAQVTQWESNPTSPRVNMPTMYLLTFNDPRIASQTGIGLTTATKEVHWTRVIHVADLESSPNEWAGLPACQQVRREILSLQKVYGASGEGYWKAAFHILSAETHPQLGGDVRVNEPRLRDAFEKLVNGLDRSFLGKGMALKAVAPAMTDPTAHKDLAVQAICIKLGIPQRVFMGTERGELASSQDDAAWNDRLKFRQEIHVTPRVIVPFIDRLIWLGCLAPPGEDGYHVDWPDLTSETSMEKADKAAKMTQAWAAYVSGGVEMMLPPMDFMTRVLGMDEEEAREVVDAAEDHAAEAQERQMQMQEDQIERGLAPDPTVDDEAKLEAAKRGAPPGGKPAGGPPGAGGPPKPGGPVPPKGPTKPTAPTAKKPPKKPVPVKNEEYDARAANGGKPTKGGRWITTEDGSHAKGKGGAK